MEILIEGSAWNAFAQQAAFFEKKKSGGFAMNFCTCQLNALGEYEFIWY